MIRIYDDESKSLRHFSMAGSKGENENSELGTTRSSILASKFDRV